MGNVEDGCFCKRGRSLACNCPHTACDVIDRTNIDTIVDLRSSSEFNTSLDQPPYKVIAITHASCRVAYNISRSHDGSRQPALARGQHHPFGNPFGLRVATV